MVHRELPINALKQGSRCVLATFCAGFRAFLHANSRLVVTAGPVLAPRLVSGRERGTHAVRGSRAEKTTKMCGLQRWSLVSGHDFSHATTGINPVVKGHDFSRAEATAKNARASAPEGRFSISSEGRKPGSALTSKPRVNGSHYPPDKFGTDSAVLELGHELEIPRAAALTVELAAPAPALFVGPDRREMSRRP